MMMAISSDKYITAILLCTLLSSSSAFLRYPITHQSFLQVHNNLQTSKSNFGRINHRCISPLFSTSVPPDDSSADDEGVNLAAEFYETLKKTGISKDVDLEDDDDDDDDDEVSDQVSDEDEDLRDIPISKVNAFTGRDEGGVGKLAGNVTFTNKELYDSLKERVLESPEAFVHLVGNNGDDETQTEGQDASTYKPPELEPDSGLTAGEVVTLVLNALLHNDIPSENYGIRVLFSYSSPASVLTSEKAPTTEEYADFLKTSEYKALLEHNQVIIDKADYSFNGLKAFYNVRLKTGTGRNFTLVNFILSTKGHEEEDCWLIDSILIRSEGMGRNRRKR